MSLAQGVRLGPYEIVAPLGAGGMGEVYRARDVRLGREVAIKALPGAVSGDSKGFARLQREARLLAALNHPNVAVLHDVLEEGGAWFLVMEYVPGQTLRHDLKVRRYTVREALEVARQVAAGLDAAHASGIIHRDLKPENVQRTPGGQVKLLDFGLAKSLRAQAPDDGASQQETIPGTSEEGMVIGTAAYMSPEQTRGLPLDRRTDVWSFGCLLYELLSGKPAFWGRSRSEIVVGILEREPHWEELPQGTPEAIRTLLARCLAKDVDLRLRDVGEARHVIEEHLSGIARGVTVPVPRTRRRLPARIWVAAALLAAAVAALLLLRQLRSAAESPAGGPRVLAVAAFRDLSGEPAGQLLGDGLAETVSARLSGAGGIQVVPPAASSPAPDDPLAAARRLGANLLLRGTIQRAEGRLRVSWLLVSVRDGKTLGGDTATEAGSDLFDLQDRVALDVRKALALPRGRKASSPGAIPGGPEAEARYLRALGLLQRFESEGSIDEAIAVLKSIEGADPARSRGGPLVQAALARAYLHKHTLTRETSWAAKAQDACRLAEESDPDRPEVRVTLGKVHLATGRLVEAEAAFRRALDSSPDDVEALFGLAESEQRQGRTPSAIQATERAIALRPEWWVGYNRLGWLRSTGGDYTKAAEAFRRVVALVPDNTRGWNNLGQSLLALGRLEEARSAAVRSLQAAPTSLAYSTVGNVDYQEGRYAEAVASFRKAVELAPSDFILWFNLAEAERWAPGLSPRARASYERAIALAEGELAVNPRDSSVLALAAVSLAKTGKSDAARERIARAIDLDPGDPEVLYQAAVVAEVTGDRREALKRLGRSVERGSARSRAARDPELRRLVLDPAYESSLPAPSTVPQPTKGDPR